MFNGKEYCWKYFQAFFVVCELPGLVESIHNDYKFRNV